MAAQATAARPFAAHGDGWISIGIQLLAEREDLLGAKRGANPAAFAPLGVDYWFGGANFIG